MSVYVHTRSYTGEHMEDFTVATNGCSCLGNFKNTRTHQPNINHGYTRFGIGCQ